MSSLTRRSFLRHGAAGLGFLAGGYRLVGSPFLDLASAKRPAFTHGITSGDVETTRAVILARSDRPARMWVELSARPDFAKSERFEGTKAVAGSDFNAHAFPDKLLPATTYHYRVRFESLDDPGLSSPPAAGRFSTAPNGKRDIRFLWSGDTAGQGFGIDPAHGGMRTYAAMQARKPDFFVHCGDLIYADNPMPPEIDLDDGGVWKNQLTEAKTRVAESLDDFRQNFYYNLTDDHVRSFLAETPIIQQWDDHEVVNNWYPGEILEDDRYTIKDVNTLAARARTAFFNCNPIRHHPTDPRRIHRKVSYGPLLDLFVIDLRSYRGPNSGNRQPESGPETAFLGEDQLNWLKRSLRDSEATWKIVCSDMPIGLVVAEWGKEVYEAAANEHDGPPLGRERELAKLFRFIARENIENVHFVTADVHYCASHYYDPAKAAFKDFKPFWEFVSGPLHAGSFGPNALDNTFGPSVVFKGIPDDMKPFSPPSKGYQFFGEMEIDGETRALTVRHFNRDGVELWSKTLPDASKI